MKLSLTKSELIEYVLKQINTFYPDKHIKPQSVSLGMDLALERTEYCFSHIKVKGYQKDGQVYFYHLHSDQYSQFLYYLANSIWKLGGDSTVCDKLILLNKALHGIWVSYKGELPDIFLLTHPVGTVLGNAKYANGLVVSQNVTVNTNEDLNGNPAPVLGRGLFLSAGVKIIGNKSIGDRVTLGVDVCIYKKEILSDIFVYRPSSAA